MTKPKEKPKTAAERSQAWRLAYPEKAKESSKASRDKRQLQGMLYKAKTRAERSGREFSIVLADLVVPEVCPIFGIPLVFGASEVNYNFSPSLDRIDSSRGYVKGNIQIISRLANCMKWTATPEQLLEFALGILSIYRNNGVPLPRRD